MLTGFGFARAQPARQFQAIHAGHLNVDEGQLKLPTCEESLSFYAIFRQRDSVPQPGQQTLDHATVNCVVLDDENIQRIAIDAFSAGRFPGADLFKFRCDRELN